MLPDNAYVISVRFKSNEIVEMDREEKQIQYDPVEIPYNPENYESLMVKMFENVYESKRWGRYGGMAYSGTGSLPMLTLGYRRLISSILKRFNIGTVLDAACGLWTFSALINWQKIERYTGLASYV